MSPKIRFRLLLILSLFEGGAVFFVLFSEKSMGKNALLFGLSAERLGLVLVVGLLLLTLVFLLLSTFKQKSIELKIDQKISSLSEKQIFVWLLIGFGLFLLTLEMITLFPTTEYYLSAGVFEAAYDSLLPILVWLLLVLIQIMIYLMVQRPLKGKEIWAVEGNQNTVWLVISILLTLGYWLILLIKAPTFTELPHWFGYFLKKSNDLQLGYVLPLFFVVWGGVKAAFSKTLSPKLGLGAIILVGFLSQVLFGFTAGEGFESIRKSYADEPISTTVNYACAEPNISGSIRSYEKHHGADFWVKTKPPGFLAGHILFANFVKLISRPETIEDCRLNYTQIGSFLFPLLATLVVIPMTYLSKEIFKLEFPLVPGLIYVLTPNFIKWVMVADQVFFPLVFLLNFVLFYKALKHNSMVLAVAAGIVSYLSIFLTFSMLPLIGLFVIWAVFDWVTDRRKQKVTQLLWLALGFAAGFFLLYLLFYFLLDYNALSRYQAAFSSHRGIKDFQFGIQSIASGTLLNSIEYFIWTGIPLLCLGLSYVFTGIKKVLEKNFDQKYIYAVSFALLYLALNLFSQTYGEVQRLWIFLSPSLAFLASAGINKRSNDNQKLVILLLLFTQIITTVLNLKQFVY